MEWFFSLLLFWSCRGSGSVLSWSSSIFQNHGLVWLQTLGKKLTLGGQCPEAQGVPYEPRAKCVWARIGFSRHSQAGTGWQCWKHERAGKQSEAKREGNAVPSLADGNKNPDGMQMSPKSMKIQGQWSWPALYGRGSRDRWDRFRTRGGQWWGTTCSSRAEASNLKWVLWHLWSSTKPCWPVCFGGMQLCHSISAILTNNGRWIFENLFPFHLNRRMVEMMAGPCFFWHG